MRSMPSKRGFIAKARGVKYAFATRADYSHGFVLTPQARSLWARFCGQVLRDSEIIGLLEKESVLETRQSQYRVFRYYVHDLVAAGLLAEFPIKADLTQAPLDWARFDPMAAMADSLRTD